MRPQSDIWNSREWGHWRWKSQELAKRSPGTGVITVQMNHVGPSQGVMHPVGKWIRISLYIIHHDEFGARVPHHERTNMRSQ